VTRGQKPSKRGYLFGFGNTEESYRIMIYGTAARGLPTDGPLLSRDTVKHLISILSPRVFCAALHH
jgi:hypothetical protein